MILFIKCSLAVTHLFPARDEKQYFIQQKWLIENGAVHSGGRRFFSSCAVLAWSWTRWAQLCTPYRLTAQFVLFKIYSFKKVTLNAKKQCFNYDVVLHDLRAPLQLLKRRDFSWQTQVAAVGRWREYRWISEVIGDDIIRLQSASKNFSPKELLVSWEKVWRDPWRPQAPGSHFHLL